MLDLAGEAEKLSGGVLKKWKQINTGKLWIY